MEEPDYRFERLTGEIIGIYYDTFNELGQGFAEKVCAGAMTVALTEAGLSVRRRVPLTVWFRGQQVGYFEADAVVDNVVLLEFKAAATIEPWHEAQVLNYLRASDLEIGLLLNFGPQAQFKRLAYSNSRKKRLPGSKPGGST